MQIACIAYMGPNQSGVAVMARIIPQQKQIVGYNDTFFCRSDIKYAVRHPLKSV